MKLAFAVPDLGASDLSLRLVSEGNKWVQQTGNSLTVLFQRPSRIPVTPLFATTHLTDGWGYDGAVVATSFRLAEQVLGFPSPVKRALLCWDLDWLREPMDVRRLQSVYRHPELVLLARCRDHARVLSSCWNREVKCVNGLDLPAIAEAVK